MTNQNPYPYWTEPVNPYKPTKAPKPPKAPRDVTKQDKNYVQLFGNILMITAWLLVGLWPVAVVQLVVALWVWNYRTRQRARDKWMVDNINRNTFP